LKKLIFNIYIMELNKIDEQIKALQKKKKEALKKQEEKIKSDFLKKVIGKDFEKISNILKSNPDSNFELYLNGKPLNEHFKENN
jgi:hypothetical protein